MPENKNPESAEAGSNEKTAEDYLKKAEEFDENDDSEAAIRELSEGIALRSATSCCFPSGRAEPFDPFAGTKNLIHSV